MKKSGPTSRAPQSAAATRGASPSLLFTAADQARIRATLARPEFAIFARKFGQPDLAADTRFFQEKFNPADLNTDLNRSGAILLRSAFFHAVAPESGQGRIARLAWDRILSLPRWDWFREVGDLTVGIMRCPMVCVATTLAADWLGDVLTDADRTALAQRFLAEDGPACARAVAGMTHQDQVIGWTMVPPAPGAKLFDVSHWPKILDQTNLRIIATSGLAAVAGFLKDRHPAAAATWAAEARDSLRLFASRMPADESFDEGIAYWDFTFTYYILAQELLRLTHGIDERGNLDYPAMARYAAAMVTPTRTKNTDTINFGDAGGAALANPLTWIARTFRDGTAQTLVQRPGAILENEISCLAAIWFDPDVPAQLAADLPLDRHSAPGLIVSRTGWDPDAAILSFRCGGPANHEHADRNSVLFIAHGERLLHDPFGASYFYHDPRWLLRQTSSHTAVIIDGQGHVYHDGSAGTHDSLAAAKLVDYQIGLDLMRATSDATEAYRLNGLPVCRVRRTVVFLKPAVVVILDDVALERAAPVQARFQVFNDDQQGKVTAAGTRFRIDRPAASLVARVLTAGPATVATSRIEIPDAGDQYPYAEIASAPALEHRLLTVCTAAPVGVEHGELTLTAVGADFQVRGTHLGRKLNLLIGASADSQLIVK